MIDTKQGIIEKAIDKHTGEMGRDMMALIALSARQAAQNWKPNMFIKQFSKSLGFKQHIDTAVRIIKYLYPENRAYWKLNDERYLKRVKESAWLRHNQVIIK